VSFGQAPERGIQRMDILRDAIAQWSLDYDLVLLDIAPLLPSADAELLIDAIGQVFLVVEANAATKGEVARARAQLEKMAPDALGLVVNRVSMELGGQELKAQLVETITGGSFSTFMSLSFLRLQLEMLRVRWSRKRFWFRR
jgi:Mrp family chromosome partitioning ATPase